jgi:hypothetical protein
MQNVERVTNNATKGINITDRVEKLIKIREERHKYQIS